jgi:hypothetical protein
MTGIQFLIQVVTEAFKLVLIGRTKGQTFAKWFFVLIATVGPVITVSTPVELVIDPLGQPRKVIIEMGWIITGLVLLCVVPAALALAWKAVPRVVIDGPPFQEDTGENNWHSRIRVRNISGKTLRCSASLERADPPLPHCPIPLHCSHLTRPHSDVVTLEPGKARIFDVCRIYNNSGRLEVTGAVFEGQIPLQRYIVTIVVYADGCLPETKQFEIEPMGGVVDFRAI